MIQLFTYHTGCKACGGEGIVSETYPSIGGVGGAVTVDAGCKACNATGRGELVEVPYCDVCDGENIENGVCLDCETAPTVTHNGGTVDAPGFTTDTFASAVDRAKRDNLRVEPCDVERSVMVSDSTGNGWYLVSRTSCECKGHQSHGRCKHRALAIWLVDVHGIDITKVPVIGINANGDAVPLGRMAA